MSSRILYIALFLFFVSFCCSEVKRGPSKQRHPRPCCKKYSEAVVSTDVIGHTYHEVPAHALCFKALIFKTPNGHVCVDPKEEWAQKRKLINMTKHLRCKLLYIRIWSHRFTGGVQ
uniref:Chemokine interleukin-8-like domain-containing protein n=1 Tax=Labrus bergylta TaxID=56723 RepID=A0A3Q3MRS4_9LABR